MPATVRHQALLTAHIALGSLPVAGAFADAVGILPMAAAENWANPWEIHENKKFINQNYWSAVCIG